MEFLQLVSMNDTRYIVNPQKIVRIVENRQNNNTSIYMDDGSFIDTYKSIKHWENKLRFIGEG